jgi:iron complex transport system permease protein
LQTAVWFKAWERGKKEAAKRQSNENHGCHLLLVVNYRLFPAGPLPIQTKNFLASCCPKSSAWPFWSEQTEAIFFNVRLPRIILGCLVGCCLSAAGAAYQGIFKTPWPRRIFLALRQARLRRTLLSCCMAAVICYSERFLFQPGSVALVYFISKKAKGKVS